MVSEGCQEKSRGQRYGFFPPTVGCCSALRIRNASGLIESLGERLTKEFGKGFQSRNLWWMRDFYLKFPILNAVRSELSWTHYRLLLRVENPDARAFYETEAVEGNWSTRQLERQINSLFFERALLSKHKRALLAKGRAESEKQSPTDFAKDPFVLEFLGLRENRDYLERDLETAILDHLQGQANKI